LHAPKLITPAAIQAVMTPKRETVGHVAMLALRRLVGQAMVLRWHWRHNPDTKETVAHTALAVAAAIAIWWPR
jgi:hypothetical protein